MDERRKQYWIGVMITSTVLIALILVVLFGDMPTFRSQYRIFVLFPTASGVTEGSSVRKSGVLIGRVSTLPELRDDGVLVTMLIDRAYKLYPEERCRITYTTLGDAKIEFILPRGLHRSEPVEPDYAGFRGEPSQEPVEMVGDLQSDLRQMMIMVSGSARDLNAFAKKASEFLDGNKDLMEGTVTQARKTMSAIETTMNSANQILGDPKMQEKLRQSLAEAPELIHETRETVARFRKSLELVDENLANIRKVTEPMGEYGEEFAKRIAGTLENADTFSGELAKFTAKLNNPNGSLGRLLDDPSLYNNVSETVRNVNEIVREVRPMVRDLRPILDDARVFTDKIARHPEQLGVRGALDKRPGIK